LQSPLSKQKHLLTSTIGQITYSIPLVSFLINGTFMRLSGDDYCYGDLLKRSGFWKAQWLSYLQPQAYNGNRYSLTFFSDLSTLFGPMMNAILPGFIMIAWLVGLIYALHWLSIFVGIRLKWEIKLFLAELLAFFTLYMAPSLAQSLYWRSGMLPYLAPLVLNTFLISILIKQIYRKNHTFLSLAGTSLLAFISGGFSETATTLQVGHLILLLIICLVEIPRGREWAISAWKIIVPALFASIIAFLLLALSPSNADRLARSAHSSVLNLVLITLRSTAAFILESMLALPIPTIVLLLSSAMISWIFFSRASQAIKLSQKQYVIRLILIIMISIYLIACCVAPSAYAQSAFPELRSLITARFVMVLAFMAIRILTGLILQPLFLVQVGTIALIAILCLYPLYSTRNIIASTKSYQRWATFWDERDHLIRTAKQNNIVNVEVVKIDHIIPEVGELSEDPGYWYNSCAAGYYGVKSIIANQSGWDVPQP
jgi:hypothetical protein